jgi:hypothetical protein
MTTLVPYDYAHESFTMMTSYLDKILSTTQANISEIEDFELNVDGLYGDLGEIENYSCAVDGLDSCAEIAHHALGLRLEHIDAYISRLWYGVATDALRQLAEIHTREIGPIPADMNVAGMFEIWTHWSNGPYRAYLCSHSVPGTKRFSTAGGSFGFEAVVVTGPRWVHDLYRRLIASPPHDVIPNARLGEFVVGTPDTDTFETATQLWDTLGTGPLADFSEAYRAAQHL